MPDRPLFTPEELDRLGRLPETDLVEFAVELDIAVP